MFRRRSSTPPASDHALAELRDIDSPAAAARAGAEFGREPHFADDLRRVRPWLAPELGGREVLARVFDTEWTGFLALLGEDGPWVYAATIRDLSVLSRLAAHDRAAFWTEAAAQAERARRR